MSYTDRTLACRECGKDFTFTVEEQEFHDRQGFTNTPARCPECRARRKASGQFGGPRHSNGPREMHTAVCSECGREAQVPFLPRGDKPVYCSDCFQTHRAH